ncbi:unnamed protein product [Rhizoctonia solani]|uniref:Uncharacterized protein n=1 Tax=Rhizoctonia solani TaxID=456999 RepID=A0A8H3CRI0_9AGAM|nr:uncharacterized protein RhiXN_11768 [Rhizoctonia solani]QRW24856.1 hypothetical protein RhiXN_11768 [Rhizoctonia solani]CAE6492757.1 unnamed protein product [Rhizoctonia solani]
MATIFNRRNGNHVFRVPTKANGWASLVNCWHQQVYNDLPVDYDCVQTGADHEPQWTATPRILGERNDDYRATGAKKSEAIEESARLIAASGHC